MINLLSETQAKILSSKYNAENLVKLAPICSEANKLGMVYLLNDVKSVMNKMDSKEEVQKKVEKLV